MKFLSNILYSTQVLSIFLLVFLFGITQSYPKKLIQEFEVGLGKQDAYFGQHYKIHQNLYKNHSKTIVSTPVIIDFHNCVKLYKESYFKNKVDKIKSTNAAKIPKIIHQIWLGSPFPEKYKHWQKTWLTLGSDWEYKLWTDKEVKELVMENRDLYETEKNWGGKSDILRMEILNQFGGIYVDTDFECIRPEMFNDFVNAYDFFCSMHPLDCQDCLLQNALIAAVPGHPVIKGYIEELKQYYPKHRGDVIKSTGPGMFTWSFFKYEPQAAKKGFKDIVFPPIILYPLGLCQIQGFNNKNADYVKSHVVKPETVAIHWWEGSWH